LSNWVSSDNLGLVTDFYELTMAQAYVSAGQTRPATFELFVRALPDNRRFLVAAGLADLLSALEAFHFSPASVEYLESLGRFDRKFLAWLEDVRFDGDIWAVPEGEVVFENEPIVRVTASLPVAQLL
jgi:nicotinate phosphoribosyltransferase